MSTDYRSVVVTNVASRDWTFPSLLFIWPVEYPRTTFPPQSPQCGFLHMHEAYGWVHLCVLLSPFWIQLWSELVKMLSQWLSKPASQKFLIETSIAWSVSHLFHFWVQIWRLHRGSLKLYLLTHVTFHLTLRSWVLVLSVWACQQLGPLL